MKKLSAISFFTAVFFISCFESFSQTIITGPACALSGKEYQYTIKGNIPSDAQVCVSGGEVTGTFSSCITNLEAGYVRITWNSSKGSVTFKSSEGKSSIEVIITTPLQAGNITTNKAEFITYKASGSAISCSKPSGGGCGGTYSFQWQRSLDNLNWEDIKGAISQNLGSLPDLIQTYFYRRRTIENISQSVGYSDATVIYVAPDMKGH